MIRRIEPRDPHPLRKLGLARRASTLVPFEETRAPDLALRTFRTLERIDALLYLQKFIQHEGCDLRVMVLDGRVLAAMRRRSPHDFRTNISRQAQAEPVILTAQECDWSLRASNAVGTRIAGVDILYDRSGAGYVIEVNGVPGWRALARVTACDVAHEMIHSLERANKNK